MDDWENIKGTWVPDEKDFYSHLNMENFTDVDYIHTERIYKDFEIKNLGEYHDSFVQSDISLLAGVFNKCKNMCFEIYGLDSAYFLSVLGLG